MDPVRRRSNQAILEPSSATSSHGAHLLQQRKTDRRAEPAPTKSHRSRDVGGGSVPRFFDCGDAALGGLPDSFHSSGREFGLAGIEGSKRPWRSTYDFLLRSRGGTANAPWTATAPVLSVETDPPDEYEYEVRIFDYGHFHGGPGAPGLGQRRPIVPV